MTQRSTKKIVCSFCLALAMSDYIPGPALAASFDCSKAATRTEKMICDDEELSAADDTLAATYDKALAIVEEPEVVKMVQQEWVEEERNTCYDAACLANAYQERTASLQDLIRLETEEPTSVASAASAQGTQREVAAPSESVPSGQLSDFGYKAIKFGMTPADVARLGVCELGPKSEPVWLRNDTASPDFKPSPTYGEPQAKCYEIEGERKLFGFSFDSQSKRLVSLAIPFGMYGSDHFSNLNGVISQQYSPAFVIGQDEIAAFDSRQRDTICNLYRDGSVALCISRFGQNNYMYVRYMADEFKAKFLKNLGINLARAKPSDF